MTLTLTLPTLTLTITSLTLTLPTLTLTLTSLTLSLQAAEQNNMDPTIINIQQKKKRRAPPPPNPFTGEVDSPEPEKPDLADLAEDELGVTIFIKFNQCNCMFNQFQVTKIICKFF